MAWMGGMGARPGAWGRCWGGGSGQPSGYNRPGHYTVSASAPCSRMDTALPGEWRTVMRPLSQSSAPPMLAILPLLHDCFIISSQSSLSTLHYDSPRRIN
jgi:hypothetical protein